MKTILVATDGSEHSKRAVKIAADIAGKYDSKLLLVNVLENRPLSEAETRLAGTEYSNLIERRVRDSNTMDTGLLGPRGVNPIFAHHTETGMIFRTALGEGLLEAANHDAKSNGAADIETILENGDPAKTILDVADKRKVDLIVVGSHGQSDLKSMFMGSVSHKIANLSKVNVLTVK